jgi:hypothetical protein
MALNPQNQTAGLPISNKGGAAWIQSPYPDGITAPTRSARQHQQEDDPHTVTMRGRRTKNKNERVVVGCYTFCMTLKIRDMLEIHGCCRDSCGGREKAP